MLTKLKLIILMAVLILVPASSAQANSLVPNETHFYTVSLRSDKRALNYARIVFENNHSENEQDSYKFSLPKGTKVQDLSVQQVLAKRNTSIGSQPCKSYETYEDWYSRTNPNQGISNSLKSPYMLKEDYNSNKICLEQNEVDATPYDENYDYTNDISSNMYSYSYYGYYDQSKQRFDYSDLTLEEKDGEYTARLSNNIRPGKQGSVLISYVAEDLVTGFLGRYDYNYRTLVSRNMISKVTVAINFDAEMYSREAKQKRATEASSGSETQDVKAGLSANGASALSRSTDDLLFSVGRGGVYTKTQSSLLPGDVMSVKGTFAENPMLLFIKEIIITLLALVAIVALSILGVRYRRKKYPKAPKDSREGDDNRADVRMSSAELSAPSNVRLGVISLASFFAALFVGFAGTGIVSAMSATLNIGWGIYPLVQVVWMLFSYVYVAFLFPLAYVLHHYSAKSVLRWTIIQMIVFAVLGAVIIFIFGFMLMAATGGGAPEPVYY